jgi:hypothetical protein
MSTELSSIIKGLRLPLQGIYGDAHKKAAHCAASYLDS